MLICQRWAQINRKLIVNLIMDFITEKSLVSSEEYFKPFESVHNYIGDDNIIRKGAISARLGEKCVIPLNMRDGSLICIGKGNEDWNFSAPYGAGRIMSRSQAFKEISLEDFKKSMEDVYSETVTEYTKDESPMVYKSKYEIMDNIKDTVDIETIIKPIFNFKAAFRILSNKGANAPFLPNKGLSAFSCSIALFLILSKSNSSFIQKQC